MLFITFDVSPTFEAFLEESLGIAIRADDFVFSGNKISVRREAISTENTTEAFLVPEFVATLHAVCFQCLEKELELIYVHFFISMFIF